MLELMRSRFPVWEVHTTPELIDAVGSPSEMETIRVAPDEVMLLSGPDTGRQRVFEAPGAIVVEATDGWACWSLRGDDVRGAFAMLSEVSLPAQGAICCAVAHIPARVIVRGDDHIDLFVASPNEAYLRERILSDCASLKVKEVAPA